MDVIDINNDSIMVNSLGDSLAQTADIKNNMHILNGSVGQIQQTRGTQGATGAEVTPKATASQNTMANTSLNKQ